MLNYNATINKQLDGLTGSKRRTNKTDCLKFLILSIQSDIHREFVQFYAHDLLITAYEVISLGAFGIVILALSLTV